MFYFCSTNNDFHVVYEAHIISYTGPHFVMNSHFFTLSQFSLSVSLSFSLVLSTGLYAVLSWYKLYYSMRLVMVMIHVFVDIVCIHMKTLMKKGHNKPNWLYRLSKVCNS